MSRSSSDSLVIGFRVDRAWGTTRWAAAVGAADDDARAVVAGDVLGDVLRAGGDTCDAPFGGPFARGFAGAAKNLAVGFEGELPVFFFAAFAWTPGGAATTFAALEADFGVAFDADLTAGLLAGAGAPLVGAGFNAFAVPCFAPA
jgi:hypothetical protein